MIGKRLKLARSAAGLSLRGLQEKIGNRVTAQAIGKYERDESMPGFDVLTTLASALDVPMDYLLGDPEIELESVEFRKKASTSAREDARIKARVIHLAERYLVVEEALGLPGVAWDRPPEVPFPVLRDLSEAEEAASSLRRHWGLGRDPIPCLVELLEERGIKVLALGLGNVDGLTAQVRCRDMGAFPVIVVNNYGYGDRQRFTLAHELGHLAMDVGRGLDGERAAHRFAGAFLMPAEILRRVIGKHRTSISLRELVHLKRQFGVSVQSLAHRCHELGVIGGSLHKRLFEEFRRRGWRSPPYREPCEIPAEVPTRFERLTLRALAEHAISRSKAAELFGVPLREFENRMQSVDIDGPMDLDRGQPVGRGAESLVSS